LHIIAAVFALNFKPGSDEPGQIIVYHAMRPEIRLGFLISLLIVVTCKPIFACTVFSAALNGIILAGNNEDWYDSNSKICFYPGETGQYGRFIFRDLYGFPQGGMNQCGLFYDIAATPLLEITSSLDKIPIAGRDILTKCLEECSTVKEVLKVFNRYNLQFMGKWQVLFADSTGSSVIIEGDEVIQKENHYQVMTNFNQSLSDPPYSCPRYNTAVEILDSSNKISVELFRDICAATHQVHDWYTQYSNVCDLKNGIIYLYLKYNFNDVTVIDLKEELQKGENTYLVSSYVASVDIEQISVPSIELFQNYPNPFHTSTNISCYVPVRSMVRFSCYNLMGEVVWTKVKETMLPGMHTLVFDGSRQPPGQYIYAIETKRIRIVRKMVLLR
jgi:hypothetical protein